MIGNVPQAFSIRHQKLLKNATILQEDPQETALQKKPQQILAVCGWGDHSDCHRGTAGCCDQRGNFKGQ